MKRFFKKLTSGILSVLLIFCCLNLAPKPIFAQGISEEESTPLPHYPGKDSWVLTFEDNFDGTTIDETKWTIRDRDQYVYHDKTFPTVKDGNLWLKIEKDETGRVMLGRIDTHKYDEYVDDSKWSQKYGFFECRADVPETDKTYFAFWFMSAGVFDVGNDGRDGTEIDVCETAYLGDWTASTLHWDGYDSHHKSVTSLPRHAPDLHDGYHTFGLEWDPDTLKFYYDGKLTWTYSGVAVPWVKEYIILSSGTGDWVQGNIKNANLPYYAKVDYVRAWQKVDVAENGNFETGNLSPWISEGNSGITSSNTYTNSSYAGYVTPGGILEQEITGLEPNTTYVFTSDLKLENKNEYVYCGAKDFGGIEVFNRENRTEYGPTKVTFTTGPFHTSSKIYFYKPAAAGNGKAFLDEVTVCPQRDFIGNSTFESGDQEPWTSYNTSGVTNETSYEGNYSGFAAAGSSIEQVVTGLQPYTTYKFSAYVKSETEGEPSVLGVKDFGGAEVSRTVISSDYEKAWVIFKTEDNTTAKIYLTRPSGNGKGYLDAATLTAEPHFVINGDFETGEQSPWTSYHSAYITNADVYAGDYAGCVEPDSSIEQIITGLRPNTTYTFSAYVKVEKEGDTAYLGVKDFGVGKPEVKVPALSTDYQEYSVTFKTGIGKTSAKIYLTKPAADGDGNAYLDQARISPNL